MVGLCLEAFPAPGSSAKFAKNFRARSARAHHFTNHAHGAAASDTFVSFYDNLPREYPYGTSLFDGE